MENNIEIGLIADEVCNRNGCNGIMEDMRKGGCSCHVNPPCSYCTDDNYVCNKCEASVSDENQKSKSHTLPSQKKSKSSKEIEEENKLRKEESYKLDDGSLYEVNRYFDDVFEVCVGKDLTLGGANKLRDEKNDAKPRHYVYYSIRKQR